MSILTDLVQKVIGKKPLTPLFVNRETLNYDEVKEVGLLFSNVNDDNHKAINYFVKLLKKDGKNVKALAFFEDKHSNPYDVRFDFFTAKDIIKGQISSLQVNEFVERRFDYLYCISLHPFPVFDFIMERSQAKCRIGKYDENHINSYDLMVEPSSENDSVELILQMIHYTKTMLVNNYSYISA